MQQKLNQKKQTFKNQIKVKILKLQLNIKQKIQQSNMIIQYNKYKL